MLIEGKVIKNFREENEVKIDEISLLADLLEKRARSVTALIPLENITGTFISDFDALLKDSRGKTSLKIKVLSEENECVSFSMVSHKVDPGALIDFFRNKQLKYKIN